jgi:hypothetical protein
VDDVVMSTNTLPELLRRHIRSNTVHAHEENGVIILTPINNSAEQAIHQLCGMFAGKLSTHEYMEQKQADKELEP